jgi:hypothetical protein
MAKRSKKFQLFIVSVDFDTRSRTPPYYRLKIVLARLGGVIIPTHQIRLLLTPFSATMIRDNIRRAVLRGQDRVYVGKIAKGSAWHKLSKISNNKLKAILKNFAAGAQPEKTYIMAARRAVEGVLPLGASRQHPRSRASLRRATN